MLSLAILALSCGKEDKEDKTSKVTVDQLEGTWVSACFNFNGFDQIGTLTYDASANYSIALKYFPEDKSKDLSDRCVTESLLFTQLEKGSATLGNDIGDGVTEMTLSASSRSTAITPTALGVATSDALGGLSVTSALCYKVAEALTKAGSTLTTSYATPTAWSADTETVLWNADADGNPTVADACGAGILQPRYVVMQINSAGKLLTSDISDLTKGATESDRITTINALLPFTKQ